MSSADLLRLAIVRETTPGITPANPAWQLVRATSESLAYQPETQLSNELNPARQVTGIIISGGASGGDISFEVSSNPGFELMLEAVLAELWAVDDILTVGTMLLTHSIEKRFTVDEDNVDPNLRYEYNRAVRSLFDQMALTFTPGGPATGSATILGGAFSRDSIDLAGATYLPAGTLPVVVGSGITPVMFTIGGVDYSAWCVSNLVVTFRNNGRAIACLGQATANEVVLGRFECDITADIYITTDTSVVMDAFLNNEEFEFSFEALDSLGNGYLFEFPRVRCSGCTEVASGTNQDVVMNTSMQSLVKTVTVGVAPDARDVDTCVIITRVHTALAWPDADPVVP